MYPVDESVSLGGSTRRGRATLRAREWLRLLADRGVDPLKLERLPEKRAPALRTLIAHGIVGTNARQYDFSHEVKEAMSGCLACKKPVRPVSD